MKVERGLEQYEELMQRVDTLRNDVGAFLESADHMRDDWIAAFGTITDALHHRREELYTDYGRMKWKLRER